MKNFLLAFLFGLFSVTCFANQSEFKNDKIEKQESKFTVNDVGISDFTQTVNLKLNFDFDVVNNDVDFFENKNHFYFYKEKLNANNMYLTFSSKILKINKCNESLLT